MISLVIFYIMVNTLTVSFLGLELEGQEPASLTATLQLQNKAKNFYFPFSQMTLKTTSLSQSDSLFVIFSFNNTELGHSQITLESLSSSAQLERTVLISKFNSAQDKQNLSKIRNIGKFQINLTLSKEPESQVDLSLTSINEAYAGIREVFQDFWKIQVAEQPELENLGLAVLNDEKYLNDMDLPHVRMLALGLNEKVKVSQVLRRQVNELEINCYKFREVSEKTVIELVNQKNKFEDVISRLNGENEEGLRKMQEVMQENWRIKEEVRGLNSEIQGLKGQLALISSQNEANLARLAQEQVHQGLVKSLQGQIADLESARVSLKSELDSSLQSNTHLASLFSSENSNLQSLLDQSALQIQSLLSSQASQTCTIESQANEIISLNLQIEAYHRQILGYSDLEDSLASLSSSHSSLLQKYSTLQSSFQDSITSFSHSKQLLSEEKEKIWACSREIQEENMNLQTSNLKFSGDLAGLKAEKLSLESDLNSTQQMVIVTHDQESLSKELEIIHNYTNLNTSKALKELEEVSGFLLSQSEKILNSSRMVRRLAQTSADKENEIMVLRDMISELQRKRAVYFPAKDDVIDYAIADFVNTRGTEVPFTREDHGIYVFGSKRVFVKLENGKVVRN